MSQELTESLLEHQDRFGLDLSDEQLNRLGKYYSTVQAHNPILHLVAPTTPTDFAVRHILESLMLLRHLPKGATFADIGTGAGLPSIPCLIVRSDLHGYLIESKPKKTAFLETAVEACGIAGQATILDKQFSEVTRPDLYLVTCRALDKFAQKIPQIVKWTGKSKLVLFGGPAIRDALTASKFRFTETLLPLSDQRYVFAL